MEYLLLSKLTTGDVLYDSLLVLIFLPMITYCVNFVKTDLSKMIKKCFDYFQITTDRTIKIIGIDYTYNGIQYFDYPKPMLALFHHINLHNLSDNIKYFDRNKNGHQQNNVTAMSYMVENCNDIQLDDDMHVDIYRTESKETQNSEKDKIINNDICATLKTKKRNINDIKEKINKMIADYDIYVNNKNKHKIYHFVYQGSNSKFTQKLLSNFQNDAEKNYETFDCLFSDQKETLIKSIDKLKDIEYFKKTGCKRKMSFLFYGPYGCGKTCHVSALANYSHRHIIEIPLSRVKTNKEFERILNITQINDVSFTNDNIILLFDEIDQLLRNLDKRSSKTSEENDDIHIGFILSRLDGIGNYNGLVVIGTTNYKDKLPPALYRHGRMTPLYFGYLTKKNMQDVIEFNYDMKLTQDQIDKIPEDKNITPVVIRYYIDLHDKHSVDKLLETLNNYVPDNINEQQQDQSEDKEVKEDKENKEETTVKLSKDIDANTYGMTWGNMDDVD